MTYNQASENKISDTSKQNVTLSAEELERYARHITLPDIGGAGQQKLKTARVLVIGAGGLGAPVLQYLAAAGVGTIGIIDNDTVSLSNLQRQVIHDTDKIGTLKTTSAANAILRINPNVQVQQWPFRLTPENARKLCTQYDIITDGSDNFTTRFLTADTCELLRIPLVSAAVRQFKGFLTTLKPFAIDNKNGKCNPRLQDIFPGDVQNDCTSPCQEYGILGALTGILGAMQAQEVIREIVGFGENMVGRLLIVDSRSMRFEIIRFQ